jgi:hypothetical protein
MRKKKSGEQPWFLAFNEMLVLDQQKNPDHYASVMRLVRIMQKKFFCLDHANWLLGLKPCPSDTRPETEKAAIWSVYEWLKRYEPWQEGTGHFVIRRRMLKLAHQRLIELDWPGGIWD